MNTCYMSSQDLSPESHVAVILDVETQVFHTSAEELAFLLKCKMLCSVKWEETESRFLESLSCVSITGLTFLSLSYRDDLGQANQSCCNLMLSEVG